MSTTSPSPTTPSTPPLHAPRAAAPASPVALVTGASRGIGRAIAVRLAASGHRVAINCVSREDQAQALRDELQQRGRPCRVYPADVADAAQVAEMVARVEAEMGPVEVLVNNAGILRDAHLAMMSETAWDAVLDTNLKGAFLASRAVAKGMMKRRRGHIVHMASISGLIGTPGQVNYAASKGGLIAMTRAMARELGRHGIQVNAVAPGFIDTELIQDMNPRQLDALLGQVPLARIGRCEEVAHLVNFLVSADNGYVTGQTISIDGGLSV